MEAASGICFEGSQKACFYGFSIGSLCNFYGFSTALALQKDYKGLLPGGKHHQKGTDRVSTHSRHRHVCILCATHRDMSVVIACLV